jgi:long-chain acyl-CoA synthetase
MMPPLSLPGLICHRFKESSNELAFEYRGDDDRWAKMTWSEVEQRVRRIACGLHALDVPAGCVCGIVSQTCLEWILADYGVLCAAGTTSTIYPTCSVEDSCYILGDSGVSVCFVENRTQWRRLWGKSEKIPEGLIWVWLDGEPDPGEKAMSLRGLEAMGAEWERDHVGEFEQIVRGVSRDDVASIIYTSGTTGPPKGVMLSHNCWLAQLDGLEPLVSQWLENGKQYLFLPLAHVFGKSAAMMGPAFGLPTALDGDPQRIGEGLITTRPTAMAAVPRVFEKVYEKIWTRVRKESPGRQRVFAWALGVGQRVSALQREGKETPLVLSVAHRIAERLVFRKIRDRFGGRIRFFVSGGAPLSTDIAEFFHSIGLLIMEGYGLTETTAATVVNRPDSFRFGSVGKPSPGVEVRIAPDDEVMIRGRNVMVGYANRPEATAEVIKDGWFYTGDLGRLDKDGFLWITGRKKDIIITAGGKNIAPQAIEARVLTSPFVDQCVVYGDRKPYCVALIGIAEEAVRDALRKQGEDLSDYKDLIENTLVKEWIEEHMETVNKELGSFETIKAIHLLDRPLDQEHGELTPTLKIKRGIVQTRYEKPLEALYKSARPVQ